MRFVSERLTKAVNESKVRVGVKWKVALGSSQRCARVKPGGDRVLGPERLEPNVLTESIMAGSGDDYLNAAGRDGDDRTHVSIIEISIIPVSEDALRRKHRLDLASCQPANEIEIVHEHVAENPAAAGDELTCARRVIVCGHGEGIHRADSTRFDGVVNRANRVIETALESDLE